MDMNTSLNAVNDGQLQVEETDDSCRVDFIEIVPLTKDADRSYKQNVSVEIGLVKSEK